MPNETGNTIGLFGEPIGRSVQQMFLDGDVDGLFNYYRQSGYPNYNREDYSPRAELDKVMTAPGDAYFSCGTYTKYQSANGFLFSYFPHWIDVPCGSSASLLQSWNDDKTLRELIRKVVDFCNKHNEGWSENRVRQCANVYCAKQSVSNFNPVCARLLYDEFAPNGVVYDMSMGWGGRLLGFYASSATTYIGTEPSVKTYVGLQELNTDLSRASRRRKSVLMFNSGSENFRPEPLANSVDFCFTSPPYFDTERYSDEPTQSYKAFPTPEKWMAGFLGGTMESCYKILKTDGILAVNIADVPKARFSLSIIELAEKSGFRYLETRAYEISSISNSSAKREPIYFFAKGDAGIWQPHDTLF